MTSPVETKRPRPSRAARPPRRSGPRPRHLEESRASKREELAALRLAVECLMSSGANEHPASVETAIEGVEAVERQVNAVSGFLHEGCSTRVTPQAARLLLESVECLAGGVLATLKASGAAGPVVGPLQRVGELAGAMRVALADGSGASLDVLQMMFGTLDHLLKEERMGLTSSASS